MLANLYACIPVQACPGGVSGAPVPFTVLQESVGLPEDILKRVIHSLACGTYFRVQLWGCLVRRECCVALLYCLSGTMLFLDAFRVCDWALWLCLLLKTPFYCWHELQRASGYYRPSSLTSAEVPQSISLTAAAITLHLYRQVQGAEACGRRCQVRRR
jgi:hypothetical protein